MGQRNYVNGFEVTLHPQMLCLPLKWEKPQLIFVNSMSDLFHEKVPEEFIHKVFDVMGRADRHVFQVLTKRSARLAEVAPSLQWPRNVWMGVTVESQDFTFRIDDLRKTSAAVKFVSFEPLIGPVDNVKLKDIHWVIAGGESGSGARPMRRSWATSLRDQCEASSVPFFFKQWGGVNKKAAGRELEGKLYDGMPRYLENRAPSLLFP